MTGLYIAAGLAALIVGALILAYLRGSAAGSAKVERKVEKASRETLERIDAARVDAPQTKSEVVDDLRKGEF